jgi:hypothetical protein
MQFTAKQIADFIGGRVEGNEQPLSAHSQKSKKLERVPLLSSQTPNTHHTSTTRKPASYW